MAYSDQTIRDYVNYLMQSNPTGWVNDVAYEMDRLGVSPAQVTSAFAGTPGISESSVLGAYTQARPQGTFVPPAPAPSTPSPPPSISPPSPSVEPPTAETIGSYAQEFLGRPITEKETEIYLRDFGSTISPEETSEFIKRSQQEILNRGSLPVNNLFEGGKTPSLDLLRSTQSDPLTQALSSFDQYLLAGQYPEAKSLLDSTISTYGLNPTESYTNIATYLNTNPKFEGVRETAGNKLFTSENITNFGKLSPAAPVGPAGGIYQRTPQEQAAYASQLASIPVNTAVPLPVMPMSIGPSAALTRARQPGDIGEQAYYGAIRDVVSGGQYTPAQLRQMQQGVGASSQDINVAFGRGMTPISTTTPTLPGATADTTQSIDKFIQSKAPTTSVALPTAPSMFSPENVRAQLELERLRLQPTPEPPPEEPVAGFAQGGLVGDDINRMLQNQRNAVMRESQSRQMLNTLGAPPVKKFSDGGPAGSSSGVRRLKMSGYQAGGDVTDEMFVGTAPSEESQQTTGEYIKGLYKENIPVHARVYLETLLGKKDPVTADDFTKEELADIEKLLSSKPAKGAVTEYSDYEKVRDLDREGRHSSDWLENLPSVGKTLGRFTYETLPDGRRVIKDTYDFYNTSRSINVQEFEEMGPAEKALAVFKKITAGRSMMDPPFVKRAADVLGEAYIGRDGRPVKVEYDPKDLPVKRQEGSPPEGEVNENPYVRMAREERAAQDKAFDSVNRQLSDLLERYKEGDEGITEKDLLPFFPGYNEYDIAQMYGTTTESSVPSMSSKARSFTPEIMSNLRKHDELMQKDFDSLVKEKRLPRDVITARTLGLANGGEVTNDEFIQEMFTGTRPEDFPETSAVDKKAGELLRALSEGTRGFVGAEPIEPGSEAYRTGQALANMPAVGVVAATAKGAGKSAKEITDFIKNAEGSPLVVYRGLMLGENTSSGALKGKGREGYASFGSSSPYVAASYGTPSADEAEKLAGTITPLLIKASKVVEFPVTTNRYGSRQFDKFEFDRRAQSLKSGEVLVARDVVDIGPRASTSVDPEKLYSYGSDIYAWGPETETVSAITKKAKGAGKAKDALKSMLPSAKLVDTPEFQNWFGRSKTVNEGGKPLVLYHATPKDITEFIPGGQNPELSGPAIWMTPNKDFQPAAHNLYTGKGSFVSGANVIPLFASVKNPLITSLRTWKDDLKPFGGSPWTLDKEAVSKMKKAGHDGIMYYDEKGNLEEVAVFKPTQVKSAISNEGTFSPRKKAITKAKGGEVTNDEFIQEMMTGTRPTDETTSPGILPPEIRQAVDVPLDFANLLIRGTAAVPIGGAAGLYKGITGGKYGTQEGVKEADTEAARMMAKITGEPKTQTAKDVLEFIGGKAQEYKLDAALPQLLTLPSPGPGAASALMRSYELAETPPVGTLKLAGDKGVKPATPPTDQMGFYSPAEKAVMGLPQDKGTASQMLAQITKTQGVKPVELRATGLEDYLKGKGNEPVTKQEIQDFLTNNRVQVDEVVLGKSQTLSPEAKKLSDEALSRMEAADSKMAPFFEQMMASGASVGGQEPYSTFYRIRGPLARELAKGDQDAINELYALNLPSEIRQAALDFAAAKGEYRKYSSQARRMEKPKFDKYNIPGGQNAREIYLALGDRTERDIANANLDAFTNRITQRLGRTGWDFEAMTPEEIAEYDRLNQAALNASTRPPNPIFTAPSPHSVSPEADKNRLAHIFLDERKDAKGNNVLFVQELQSDWAQQGRDKGFAIVNKLPEGYSVKQDLIVSGQPWGVVDKNGRFVTAGFHRSKEDAVAEVIQRLNTYKLPTAPFVTNTEDWVNLALKRVIKEAVDNDIDTVAFIKGGQAADKYSLRTFVDYISADRGFATGDDLYVSITPKDSLSPHAFYVGPDGIIKEPISADVRSKFLGEPLSKVIGKETAEKLLSTKIGESQVLRDEGLTLGGKGMEGFYDNILPKTAEKLLKKLGGGKVEPVQLEFGELQFGAGAGRHSTVKENYLGFKITPEMKEMVKTEGLPKFAAGGEVTDFIKRAA
jgi:hypothetical protein